MTLVFAFLSALLVSGQAWEMVINEDEVTPGVTRDVKLTCQQDQAKGDTLRLRKITRLRMVKEKPFHAKIVVATFVLERNTTSKLDDSIEVQSNRDVKTGPSLEVTWPTATKDTAGVYGCEIIGFDANEKFVSNIVASATIRVESGTMKRVEQRIQSVVEDYERKFKLMESNNTYLAEELNAMKKELKNKEDTYRTEISSNSAELNSLRKELKDQNEKYRKEISSNSDGLDVLRKDLKSQQENYQIEISNHSDELSLLRKELKNQNDNYRKEISSNSNGLDVLRKDFQNQKENYQAEISNHSLELNVLRKDLKKQEDNYQIESSKYSEDLNALRKEFNNKQDQYRAEISNHSVELDALRKELKNQEVNYRATFSNHSDELNVLRKELKNQNDNYQKEIAGNSKVLDTLRKGIKNNERNFRTEISNHSDELNALRKELKNQNDNYRNEISNNSDGIDVLRKEIKNQQENYLNEISNHSDELISLRKELKDQHDNYRAEISNHSNELSALRKQLKNQQDNCRVEISKHSDELNALRKELKIQEDQLKVEMSTHKQDMEANYVTKDNLAKTVSVLKTFTSNEIRNNDIGDQTRHRDIERKIQETENHCNTSYSNLETANRNMKKSINSEINNLNQDIQDNSKNINEKFTSAENKIAALDGRYQRVTDTLRDDLTKEIRKCGCEGGKDSNQLTTTTTIATPPYTSTDWPKGEYVLLTYDHLECPIARPFANNGHENLFEAEPFDYYRKFNSDHTVIPDQLWEIVVNNRLEKAGLCHKISKSPSNDISWPEGNYCIHMYGYFCPKPLKYAYITYHLHDSITDKYKSASAGYVLKFCCPATGDAAVPINLPVEKPFVLYRRGGKCQEVMGMNVIQLKLYLGFNGNGVTASPGNNPPDGEDSKYKQIYVCRYTPKN